MVLLTRCVQNSRLQRCERDVSAVSTVRCIAICYGRRGNEYNLQAEKLKPSKQRGWLKDSRGSSPPKLHGMQSGRSSSPEESNQLLFPEGPRQAKPRDTKCLTPSSSLGLSGSLWTWGMFWSIFSHWQTPAACLVVVKTPGKTAL